jgi:hypothetical protein
VHAGCERCRTTLDFVQHLVAVAQTADVGGPPPDAVRWAKAIGALQRPQKPSVLRVIASLVYDSLREPLAAGMRAEDHTSRHVLYEAGEFLLDLRLEHEREAALASLVGQVTHPVVPADRFAEAPVLLTARRDVVAHAKCNSFGEFQLQYEPTAHLRLRIAVDQAGGRIELPLNQLHADLPTRSADRWATGRPKKKFK